MSRLSSSTLVLALLAGLCGLAVAQVPDFVSQEGMLLDAQGAPLDGPVDLTFKLYARAAGGVATWTEVHQRTPLMDGYYVLKLGSLQPLSAQTLLTAPYLAVAINGGAEQTPRIQIGSVPFALVAKHVIGGTVDATSITIDGQPTIDAQGRWVGDPTGLRGPAGAVGPIGPQGIQGLAGDEGSADTPLQVRAKLVQVDGAGSGVDADRLDGLDSTRFVRSDRPINATTLEGLRAASFVRTAAQVLTLLKTVDGSGSGLDADRLDGRDSSEFLRPAAANAGPTVMGLVTARDGAGSSLDADRLDGLDSSKFMRVDRNTGTSGTLSASRLELNAGEMGGTARAWMVDGVKVGAAGSDGAYFGMKDEGANAGDTVVAWGDDLGDHLRFIFARSGGPADGEEYMRVTSEGNVGIGKTAPAHRLDVNGTIGATSLQLTPLANPPANPAVGRVYLDAGDMVLHVYDGNDWVALADGVPVVNAPRLAYGIWNALNLGQDATSQLPISVNYTKQEANSLLRVTFSSNMRTNGPAGRCVRWAIRINGRQCTPQPVNGNVYISPGGDYHQHHTFTGICRDVPAGNITAVPWVENCPGYGTADAYTGWQSMTALIVEEIPADESIAYGAWNALNYGHDATQALPISVTINKRDPNSLLEVTMSSSMRTHGAAGQCCRWALRVNGQQCATPVNANVYISPGGDYHHIRTLTGMCPNLPAGPVTVQPWIERCPGYANADCYTGWQSTTSLIATERPRARMAYGMWQNINRGEDATRAVPGTAVQYNKQDADSLLRLTLSANLRTNGAAGSCCRWAIRVNGQNCAEPVNGNVYINPAGNWHQHRTITGMCRGVGAGNITVQPWLEQCPGYGNSDCYTGWQSTTTVMVEEGPF